MAVQTDVCAGQWEFRLHGVIEAPTAPTIWIVAKSTIGRQPPAMVLIVVAPCAGSCGVFEPGGLVAFLARDDGVPSEQREARRIMIESDLLAPAGFFVTILTLRPELALMGIIFAVTRDTRRRQLILIQMSGVTRIAKHLDVLAAQRELRLPIVIELDVRPFRWAMAGVAFLTIASSMAIVDIVAGDTSRGQILITLTGMAAGAADQLVCAIECEFCLTMVENFDWSPTRLGMTGLAIFTEPALVWLARFVTINAADRGRTEFDAALVTTLAARSAVCTVEREICFGVLESTAIQLNDIDVPALMIGVAIAAITLERRIVAPVKSPLLLAILCHVLVAIEAKLGLRLTREGFVALHAIFFEVRVALNQGARHDETLKYVLCG